MQEFGKNTSFSTPTQIFFKKILSIWNFCRNFPYFFLMFICLAIAGNKQLCEKEALALARVLPTCQYLLFWQYICYNFMETLK